MNDTNASRDKPSPIALLMRKTSASKVPLEPMCGQTGSGEETYRNRKTRSYSHLRPEFLSSKDGLNPPVFRALSGHLPPLGGRARIPVPFINCGVGSAIFRVSQQE